MSSEAKETFNQSAGRVLSLPCTKCSGRTNHEVVTSVEQSGYVAEVGIDWDAAYQIVRCKGCDTLSFRYETSNSEDYDCIGENQYERNICESLYPPRNEKRNDLGVDAACLSMSLRGIYAETILALNNNSPVLAGIGIRALIDAVCKEKGVISWSLEKKIKELEELKIITPTGAATLDKVRLLGNKAAHESKAYSATQLSTAMTVVESMLREVYILPIQAEFLLPKLEGKNKLSATDNAKNQADPS